MPSTIHDTPATEITAFDRNGILVGCAQYDHWTGFWTVTSRGKHGYFSNQRDAEECLRLLGAVEFMKSDGKK